MHTLNEQTKIFTSDSVVQVVEDIKAWLADTFGFVHDGDYIYLSEDKKIGIYFFLSGTALRLSAKNAVVTTTINSTSTTIGLSVIVRYHVSKGESVKYICINDTTGFIVAEDEKDERYIFVTSISSPQYEVISENAVVALKGSMPGAVDETVYYGVTKMPSIFGGGSMKELFAVMSARIFVSTGLNIDFNGKIHRIVTLKPSTNIPQFSFPVGD